METQKCKGARDLLPEDMERFRQIEDAFRNACLSWGYREIKTPTLEYIHLFTAAGTLTPAMLGRVYSFLDWDGWGGERIVLRPDGTIPVARLYSENYGYNQTARLFYVTNVFAFEETGRENREKWQCGIEMLGNSEAASEAEIVSIALEVLKTLNIPDIKLRISHAGVLKTLITELKLDGEAQAALLDQILEGNWQAISAINGGNRDIANIISSLMDLKGQSSGFLANLKAMPGMSAALKLKITHFESVTSLLDELGCKYEIDFTSIRGFEYYTGLCFKIDSGSTRVCSGGRYDDLVRLVGNTGAPACGLAFYIDEMEPLVKPWSQQKAEKTVLVKLKKPTQAALKKAFSLAGSLRKAGLIAELAFRGSQLQGRWEVTVQDGKAGFAVLDTATKMDKTAANSNGVIDIIGGFDKIDG